MKILSYDFVVVATTAVLCTVVSDAEGRGGRRAGGAYRAPRTHASVRQASAYSNHQSGYQRQDTRQDARYNSVDTRQDLRHDATTRGPDTVYNQVDRRQDVRNDVTTIVPGQVNNHVDQRQDARRAVTTIGPAPVYNHVDRRQDVRHDVRTAAVRAPGPAPVARRTLKTIPDTYKGEIIRGIPYYYGAGSYYRWNNTKDGYVRVDDPHSAGSVYVNDLPPGCKPVKIDGVQYSKRGKELYRPVYNYDKVRYRRTVL
jgi:hypothetical protein